MPKSHRVVIRNALRAAAKAYPQEVGEKHWSLETRLLNDLRARSHLTKTDLVDITRWKTGGRTVHLVQENPERLIGNLTRSAFATCDPAQAIQILVEGITGNDWGG